MSFNVQGAVELPLEVFGGRVTEMSPPDCPEGVSPDEQDNSYRPGSVFSRPGLKKIFSTPVSTNTFTGAQSYVQPAGPIRNVYYDAVLGALLAEDPINAPGVYSDLITGLAKFGFMKAVTGDGRFYAALSDGNLGIDVPLQWDGTNLDRVTQEGPGSAPRVSNVILPSSTLTNPPGTNVNASPSSADFTATANSGTPTDVAEQVFTWPGGTGISSRILVQLQSTITGSGSGMVASEPSGGNITETADSGHPGPNVTPLVFTFPSAAIASSVVLTNVQSIITVMGINVCTVLIETSTDNGATWSTLWSQTDSEGPSTLTVTGPVDLSTFQVRLTVSAQWLDGDPVSSEGIIPSIVANTGDGGSGTASVATEVSYDSGATWTTVSTDTVTTGSHTVEIDGPFDADTTQVRVVATANWVSGADVTAEADITSIFAITGAGGFALQRLNNTVRGETAAAHGLQPGYMIQISEVDASVVGGGIVSIVLDNAANPGLATVTTEFPHGLAPEQEVTLQGVNAASVGSGVQSAVRAGGITTITTFAANGLTAGSVVTLAGITDTSFDGVKEVLYIYGDNVFAYADTAADASSSGGSVSVAWPVTDGDSSVFEVQSAPTATTFQIALNYGDGTWSGGVVTFPWNGLFFVTATPTATEFQYQQYGPNAQTIEGGPVTPYGQAAPGKHVARVSFLRRQGGLTAPGPSVQFVANGGQYLQFDELPIGPPDVIARVIQITGADGAYFFYLPVPAQVNGLPVSTATQVNDNTSTSVLIDASDNSLFTGIGTSEPGNNLPAQIVIDGALGFGSYNTRLLTYGQRNRLQSLLGMGFESGYLSGILTAPLGWNALDARGSLINAPGGRPGMAWQVGATPSAVSGHLQQTGYLSIYGAPILTANTVYNLRFWASADVPGGNTGSTQIFFRLVSATLGTIASAEIGFAAGTVAGKFYDLLNAWTTPATIPDDVLLEVYVQNNDAGGTSTIVLDEMSVIYAETPALPQVLYGSYGDNPEGIDGVTGKTGPALDTRALMDFGVLRNTLYMLTQEPSGRLHEVTDNGTSEPVGWVVNEVAANCGLLSAFGLAKSQADDGSASGGEEWLAWASSSGARIFGGREPAKISQEIQPDWETINPAAQGCVAVLNDPVDRLLYFALPTGSATAPNLLFTMSYRELDSAEAIADTPPYRVSFSGKLIATDNSRKWSKWNIKANALSLTYRKAGVLTATVCGGDGVAPASGGVAFGNVYTLDPATLTDDDYGQIHPYYTTYFFPSRDQAQALQLGQHRIQAQYLTAFITGLGNVTYTILADALSNPWPLTGTRTLSANPTFDQEWGAGYAQGQRLAVKITPTPATGTDVQYNLQRLALTLKPAAKMPVRGAAQ